MPGESARPLRPEIRRVRRSVNAEIFPGIYITNVQITKATYLNLKERNTKLRSDLLTILRIESLRKFKLRKLSLVCGPMLFRRRLLGCVLDLISRRIALRLKKIVQKPSNLKAAKRLLWDERQKNGQEWKILFDEAHLMEF